MHDSNTPFLLRRKATPAFLCLVVAACSLCGCAASMQSSVESVAKDWSKLIRASQVIPVYPLTEDLRPGDLFLVETPIQQQAAEFKKAGYLRLDQPLGRMSSLQYDSFYGSSYDITKGKWPPDDWGVGLTGDHDSAIKDHWAHAPRAAFPTYSFSVNKGGSANIALPVKGIPIGLALMQASSATGSVTIADAYTYGLPLELLRDALHDWYGKADNRLMVDGIRDQAKSDVYIRVIARIYLTRNLIVSMTKTSSSGGYASAGNPKEAQVPALGKDSAEGYAKVLDTLNGSLDKTVVGGSVKVVQASESSVSMSETFERPLAIGFISFDFPISSDGQLGAAMATVSHIDSPEARAGVTVGSKDMAATNYDMWLWYVENRQNDEQRSRIYASAATRMDSEFQADFKKVSVGSSSEEFKRVADSYLAFTNAQGVRTPRQDQNLRKRKITAALKGAYESEGGQ